MHPSVDAVSCRVVIHGLVSFSHGRRNADDFCSNRFLRESPGVGSHRVGTRRAQSEGETPRNVVVPSNAAEWRPRNEKNAAFEYPLADRPLRRSRYGRCTQKAMRKESAAATHRHTLFLAPNSITLLLAQHLSHQGVASQHEKPNEGAGFFFLSLYFEGLFCTLSESLSGTSRPLMAFEETR